MTTTPTQAARVSGTIKADARAAVEELANMPIGIPLEDWCRLSARILAAIQPDPEPQPVAVAWPDGFFVLPVGGGSRLRECATEGCCQHCSIRVEHGGIGSDYCEPCARKIAAPSSAGMASVEAAGWQHIETAPTDGGEFLISYSDGTVRAGRYLDNSHTSWPWMGVRPMYGAERAGSKITHWMPLPEPPTLRALADENQ